MGRDPDRAAGITRSALTESSYLAYQVGQSVMTVDGLPGVVTAATAGPFGARYTVELDNGLGGGDYGESELTEIPMLQTEAAYPYPWQPPSSEVYTCRSCGHSHWEFEAETEWPYPACECPDCDCGDAYQRHGMYATSSREARRYTDTPLVCDICGATATHSTAGGKDGHTMRCPDCAKTGKTSMMRLAEMEGGLGRVAARDLLPLAEPGTVRVASDDYPELEDILWARPDHVEAVPVNIRNVSLGQKTAAGIKGPMTLDQAVSDPDQPWWWRKVVGPAIKRVNDRLPEEHQQRDIFRAPDAPNRPDWCRFRREGHCYFPKELDEEGSKQAGYAVWIPFDRGPCLREHWTDQRDCELAEPGVNSGEPVYGDDGTRRWRDGGQRFTVRHASLRRRAAFGPDDPIYRALREVIIPYDPDKEGPISGKEVLDRALKSLRAEGLGPEKPGSWWFVHNPDADLEQAKWWANSFGTYYGKTGDKALVGFVYEARFAERPTQNSTYIPGAAINIVAVHVTNSSGQWERIPIGPIRTTAKDQRWDVRKEDVYDVRNGTIYGRVWQERDGWYGVTADGTYVAEKLPSKGEAAHRVADAGMRKDQWLASKEGWFRRKPDPAPIVIEPDRAPIALVRPDDFAQRDNECSECFYPYGLHRADCSLSGSKTAASTRLMWRAVEGPGVPIYDDRGYAIGESNPETAEAAIADDIENWGGLGTWWGSMDEAAFYAGDGALLVAAEGPTDEFEAAPHETGWRLRPGTPLVVREVYLVGKSQGGDLKKLPQSGPIHAVAGKHRLRDFERGQRVYVDRHPDEPGTIVSISGQFGAYQRGYVTISFDSDPDRPARYPYREVNIIREGSKTAALHYEESDGSISGCILHATGDHAWEYYDFYDAAVLDFGKDAELMRGMLKPGAPTIEVTFPDDTTKRFKDLDAAKRAVERYANTHYGLKTAASNVVYRGMELRGINQDDEFIEALRSNSLDAFVKNIVSTQVARGDASEWSMRMGDPGRGVGLYWTTDMEVAKSFASSSGEKFTVAMFDSWLPLVIEATYTPGTEVANPEQNSHAYGWNGKDEKEIPLQAGAPLTLVRAHVLVPSDIAAFIAKYDEDGEAQTSAVKWVTIPLGISAVAAWSDVVRKGREIRRAGGVHIIANSGTTVTAEVAGDHGIYITSITRVPGTKQVGMWYCACDWNKYVWARSAPYKRFEGRQCSHSLALAYEIGSQEMFGGTITEQSQVPDWRTVEPRMDRREGQEPDPQEDVLVLDLTSSLDPEMALLALGNIRDSLRVASESEQGESLGRVSALLESTASAEDYLRNPDRHRVVGFKAQVGNGISDVDGIYDDGTALVRGEEVPVSKLLYPTWDPGRGLYFTAAFIPPVTRHVAIVDVHPSTHIGVMVALSPSHQVSQRLHDLAVDAGLKAEPVREIHLTLAYCGKPDQIAAGKDRFLANVRAWAAQHQHFTGTLQGLGTFYNAGQGDESAVLWAAADIPGLAAARTSLMEALTVGGTPGRTDHDFTPHITLAYADKPFTKIPDFSDLAGTEMTFTTVVAAWNGEWTHLDLVGSSGETVAVEQLAVAASRHQAGSGPLRTGPGVFWRFHPNGRKWEVGGGSSKIEWATDDMPGGINTVTPGYSCFANPWHLYLYVREMDWDTSKGKVVGFTGSVAGSGFDGEPTVIPDAQPFEKMSWDEFEFRAEITPTPATPWYEGINGLNGLAHLTASRASAEQEEWLLEMQSRYPDGYYDGKAWVNPEIRGRWYEPKRPGSNFWMYQHQDYPFALFVWQNPGETEWQWKANTATFGDFNHPEGTAKTLDAAQDKALKSTRKAEQDYDKYRERMRDLMSRSGSKTVDMAVIEDILETEDDGEYAYAGLIIKALDTGRVLMTQRTPYHDDDEGAYGRWEFPGGNMDDGENTIEAAIREFQEETGLTLPEGFEIRDHLPNEANGYMGIVVVVPHETWTTDAALLTNETMGIGWFDMDQIPNVARAECAESDFTIVMEAALKRERMGPLYHGTNTIAAAQIDQHGFVAGTEGRAAGAVWLTPSYELAKRYAETAAKHKGGEPAVYEIESIEGVPATEVGYLDLRMAQEAGADYSPQGPEIAVMNPSIITGINRIAGVDPNAHLDWGQRTGNCYALAAQYVMHNSRAKLVHGTIQRGATVRHAWALDGGKVFEPITGIEYPPEQFQEQYQPVERVRYTNDEALLLMARTQEWGPWDDDTPGYVVASAESFATDEPYEDEDGWHDKDGLHVGILHDEPEPALPVAYGADDDGDTSAAINGDAMQPMTKERMAALSAQLMGQDDRSSREADAEDLAKHASEFLSKLALKTYSPAEQQALIDEGAAQHIGASNTDMLDLTGTFYEASVAQDPDLW